MIILLSFNILSVHSDKDVEDLSNKMANFVFDINNSALCKFQLFRYPDGHGGIVLLVHHLISDAWSCGLFISEIIDIYDALLDNKEIEISSFSYIDYIISENEYMQSSKFEKDKTYWMEKFQSVPELATIPSMDGKRSDIYPLDYCCGRKPKMIYYNNSSHEMWEAYCTKCGRSVRTASPSRTLKDWNNVMRAVYHGHL